MALARQGQLEDAIKPLKQVTQLAPDHPEALKQLERVRQRIQEQVTDHQARAEEALSKGDLEKLTDVLIYQEGQAADKRINIGRIINQNLSDKKEGVRYGDDPWRGQFYKDGLALAAADFLKSTGKDFFSADDKEIGEYIEKIMKNENGDARVKRFIAKVLSDAALIYYSYPESWNKIGFPGPAYPEGYAYLGCGEAEKWEPKYNMESF